MSNDFLSIESDYEYVLGDAIGNVLNLEVAFQSMEWADDELKIIAKELENTAKVFAERQGLGMSYAVESINGTKFSILNYKKTGNLINSIHAIPEGNGKINFFNNAKNSRNQFYAGHIEYGYHSRAGRFIPARPFMRPALRAVAEASKGSLSGVLKNFMERSLATSMASSYKRVAFGMGDRAFFNQQKIFQGNYTASGLYNRNSQGRWGGALSKINTKGSFNRYSKKNPGKFLGNQRSNKRSSRRVPTKSTEKFAKHQKGAKSRTRRSSFPKRGGKYNHHLIKKDIKSSSTKKSKTKKNRTEKKQKRVRKEKKTKRPPMFYNTGGSSINPYRK